MLIIRTKTAQGERPEDPEEELPEDPGQIPRPDDIAKFPPHDLPGDFPGDEDLEFLEEAQAVPPPAEIAQPPAGLTGVTPFKVPKGQQPGKPFYETMPAGFLEMEDWSYHPEGEDPEHEETVDPGEMFEEVVRQETPLEEQNRKLNIREKIFESLNTGTPLSIRYRTLPDEIGQSSVTERTVEPDYVYWPSTNRHLLMALDHLRGDWRSFAVDNILQADLVGE